MLNEGKFTIYAVETEVSSKSSRPETPSYHSFLVFAEEDDEGKTKPIQELHFVHSERPAPNNQGEDYLKTVPCLHGITKPANRDYSEMIFEEFFSGSRDDVLAQWNKMTEIASSISAIRIRFTQGAGRNAINCRTGTKAVLKALGYDFEPLNENAQNGVNAYVLDKIDDLIVDATPRVFTDDEIRQITQGFNLSLCP